MQCTGGCVDTPEPHCGVIVPSGVVTTTDLVPDALLGALVIGSAGATVNTDTGEISGVRAAGTGVVSGIDFSVRSGVGVFRASTMTVNGNVAFRGVNAVAWVATTTIDVLALLDVTGGCVDRSAGPGGGPGAAPGMSATGSGAGGGGTTSQGGYSGGAGGSHSVSGGIGGTSFPTGSGGPEIAGGATSAPFGDAAITVLRGGGGGGGGAGPGGGGGGGGAGAIQLVAGVRIDFDGETSGYAGVEASGCGGKRGAAAISSATPGGGGGGGAGGAILIEAPYIDTGFSSTLFRVIGGGGGAYDDTGLPTGDGNGDFWSRGGIPGGGTGGTREFNGRVLVGEEGGGGQSGGGGGGSVGRIRFNVITGLYVPNGGNTVPNLEDAVTTTTQGTASSI
jgi:hypothetical protein